MGLGATRKTGWKPRTWILFGDLESSPSAAALLDAYRASCLADSAFRSSRISSPWSSSANCGSGADWRVKFDGDCHPPVSNERIAWKKMSCRSSVVSAPIGGSGGAGVGHRSDSSASEVTAAG